MYDIFSYGTGISYCSYIDVNVVVLQNNRYRYVIATAVQRSPTPSFGRSYCRRVRAGPAKIMCKRQIGHALIKFTNLDLKF